jgi:hypothetical protein
VEIEHSNVVYDDYMKLKSNIEQVAKFRFPKSSPIHMGVHYPDRLILSNPADAAGMLTSTNDIWINVSYIFNQTPTYFNYSSTSLKFVPDYNLYSDAPSFVYEHGLVIKDFKMNNYTYTDTDQPIFFNNTIKVLILNYPEQSESFSEIKVLNYFPQSAKSTTNNTNVTVTLYTNYPLLWKKLLEKYNFTYENVTDSNMVKFDYPGNITINTYIINGSMASGMGVSSIPAASTPTPTPPPADFTYVFDFLNITGIVMNFSAAQNSTDSEASALLRESPVESNNYTYVTNNTTTNGTIFNWVNMQNGSDRGAFANLSEGATTPSIITGYKWYFNTSDDSWVPSYTVDPIGTPVIMHWVDSGCTGTPLGCIYATLSGDSVFATTTWISPNFTWNNGTPTSARLDFDWSVIRYKGGTSYNPPFFYVKLVKPDGSESQIYPTTNYSEVAAWSTYSNTSVSPNDFTQPGNYRVKLIATIYTSGSGSPQMDVRWDNPIITLVSPVYSLNMTTNTTKVPVDTNYYLEINYSRDSGESGYNVYSFNGTAWNLKGGLTSLVWSIANFTLSSSEVINGNVSVRYLDQTPAGSTRGNLSIDYQRIHSISPGYHLDITTNTTDIPEASIHTLQLRYNVSGDNFTLQLWNGSTWNNRTILNDTALSYRNITLLSDELIPDTGSINKYFTLVRYLDQNASAVQQGRLYLDYQRIYNYY